MTSTDVTALDQEAAAARDAYEAKQEAARDARARARAVRRDAEGTWDLEQRPADVAKMQAAAAAARDAFAAAAVAGDLPAAFAAYVTWRPNGRLSSTHWEPSPGTFEVELERVLTARDRSQSIDFQTEQATRREAAVQAALRAAGLSE